MKILLPVAIIFFGQFSAVNSAFAQTWIQATNAPNRGWSGIASSSDGVKLVAVDYEDGGIYASTNSGVTWTPLTNAPVANWETIASSADGNVIVAGSAYGFIYTSTDSGITWMSNSVPNFWVSVAISGDGSKLAAVDFYDALIYNSTNSGVSWTSNAIPNSNNSSSFGFARAVCCSADGTMLVVGTLGGTIFTSTNSGVDWTATDVPIADWSSVAYSADGIKLAAACGGGGIYTSINSGSSWTLQTNAPNENWYSIASSVDGSKLVAVAGGFVGMKPGPIYTSSDFGVTWTSNIAPDTFWYSVNSSADGCKKAAVVNGGGIYIWQYSPVLSVALCGGNVVVSWPTNAVNFVLQQNCDLTTTNWVTLTNTPTLNLTNLQDQVILSPTNSSSFFRLISQ